MTFLSSVVSADDRSADSITIGGFIALMALCVTSMIAVWRSADHHFNAFEFGGGCAAIIGAMGGGKMMRDNIGSRTS